MKVGIGYNNSENSFRSGTEATKNALQCKHLDKADLILAFCGGRVNSEKFFAGIRSVVGTNTPIIGGAAVGVITNEDVSYEGWPAAVAVIQSPSLTFRIAVADDLDKDEQAAGIRLAAALERETIGKLLLLFYDSVKIPPAKGAPPVLNASSFLLRGIEKNGAFRIPIVGAGLLGDYEFSPAMQFCGDHMGTQNAVGTLLDGHFTPYFRITHGCTPLDGIYHEITRIEGAVLYELDGKPVVQVIDELYGKPDWRDQNPVKLLTIGINHGERFAEPDEAAYVNRLIMGVLPGNDGIVLFEPDLKNGTQMQFMLRDTEAMMGSAVRNVSEIFRQIEADGRHPVFGLYIDCAGRTATYNDTSSEEATVIQDFFNRRAVPLLGFYSGVEVAPLFGKSRGLDWTGVLLVLAEDR